MHITIMFVYFYGACSLESRPDIDFKIPSLNRGEAETALSHVMSNPEITVDPLEVRYQLYSSLQAFSRFLMRMHKLFYTSGTALLINGCIEICLLSYVENF
jgi:hypothetical protein